MHLEEVRRTVRLLVREQREFEIRAEGGDRRDVTTLESRWKDSCEKLSESKETARCLFFLSISLMTSDSTEETIR